jgi:hypothetical protein
MSASTRFRPRATNSATDALQGFLFPLLLVGACAIMLATSPTNGDFWWFDAPSHAMNGVFVHDLIQAAPTHHPAQWAITYYLKYPAVTILFYPPVFPVVEAIFYFVFGVSHFTAQLAVCFFDALLALAVYRIVSTAFSKPVAFGAAMLTLGLPGIALWGRQVMLEIPAWCFAAWSVFFVLQYMESGRARSLIAGAVLAVIALYTKQTFLFMIPALALALLWRCGWRVLLRREVWIAVIVAAILVTPLAVITLKLGKMNADLASGQALGGTDRFSLAGWTYYAQMLLHDCGAIPLVLAAIAVAVAIWKRPPVSSLFAMMVSLFVAGYVFFSLIALKDERYTLHFIVPVAIAAAAAFPLLLPARAAGWVAAIAGVLIFGLTISTQKVPWVAGPLEAAKLAAQYAPPDSSILLNTHRSAAFIFDLRALGTRPDLRVIRAEKLLADYRQGRDYGVKALDVNRAEIAQYFPKYRIGVIVFQTGFWTDIPTIGALDDIIRGTGFDVIRLVNVTGNVRHEETDLRVLRYTGPLAEHAAPIDLNIPLIGQHFSEKPARKP